MWLQNWIITAIYLSLLSATALAFNADGKDNVALYWGQNSAGSQQSLATYCESSDVDVVVLSFLYQFPNNGKPGLDFASACSGSFEDGLAKCDEIANDINTCQGLGKKVLLSLGGAVGQYGFSSDSEAQDFAGTLWNMFGGGDASERPFGDSVVDGFDLDIENNNPTGYAALATKLREYYNEDSSRDYYISAAPQCVYPDASVGDALSNAFIDFAFVQFYNNPCELDRTFNWATWEDYAQSISPNPNIKIYLGLPASESAASYGYADVSSVQSAVEQIKGSDYFGGIMLWDASQGFANQVGSQNYVEAMKSILTSVTSTQVAEATSSAFESTSSSSSTPSLETTSSETFEPSATSVSEHSSVETQSASSSEYVVSASPSPSFVSTTSVESSTLLQTSSAETTTPQSIYTTSQMDDSYTTTTDEASSTVSDVATSVETSFSTSGSESSTEETTYLAPTGSTETATSTTIADVHPSTSVGSTATTEDLATSTPFIEVTTNTFTPAAPSTLKTVYYSSTRTITSEISSDSTTSVESTTEILTDATTSVEASTETPSETTTSAEAPTEILTETIISTGTTTSEISTETTTSAETPTETPKEPSTYSSPSATTSQPQATGSADCSSLAGNEKAKCMNSLFEQGLYLGSSTTCLDGDIACSSTGEIAICNYGSWVRMMCASGTTCYAYNTGDSVSVSCNFASQKSDFVKRSMETMSYKHKHNRH